jgi:2-(1,2-epoxy-1,2-dihydrophenyl)acetyl-CoA isomerase
MAYQFLLCENTDGVTTITLNHPENLNALGKELSREVRIAVEDAGRDPATRVLVIKGAGRAFSSGGDLREMAASLGDRPDRYMDELTREVYGAVGAALALDKPMVASVHGPAYGAAMNLVLACDFALAARGTVFCESFLKLGLIPGGYATTLLTRALGVKRALDICLTAREIPAEEAQRLGMITRVVEPAELEAETKKLASRLAALPPIAVRETKKLFRSFFMNSPEAQSKLERETQIAMAKTGDFAEAVKAFVEKRRPEFRGK